MCALPFAPLFWVINVTSPECEAGTPAAHKYPLTLMSSFLWLFAFSMALSAVVMRWGEVISPRDYE